MKTISKICLLALLFIPPVLLAQVQEPQTGDTTYYKTIIPEAKQGLLKNVDMIANMQFGAENLFQNGDYTGSRFRFEQFRMEFRGS
jgi:hypothetical protein